MRDLMLRHSLTTALVLLLAAPAAAQTTSPAGGTVPTAAPEDVTTIDAILGALYDVISGPAGQERDWDRFRSLFVPEAKLIPTGFPEASPKATARFITVEGYIESSGPILEERGFFEREIGRVVERFENIAHVFSTYDSRSTADGAVFARGINSIQLMWDGERWWVANIMWRGVGPDAEIPAKYLQKRE
jgi:hypothetical protein